MRPDSPTHRLTDSPDTHHTLRGPERVGPLPPEVERAVLEALGITEERVEQLRAIARLVGGDWGMRVELGKPGGGSFFSEAEGRIQLDPLHLSGPEHGRGAEFVVAHEGGHRAITRGPRAIGLKAEVARELYGKLGFAFGQNGCEDPADNDWWSEKYEGLRELPREWYRSFSESPAAMSVEEAMQTMGIPEIREMIQQLGYVPRFVHFGNELQRFWCSGSFAASGLPDDVRTALERVAVPARAYFTDVPGAHPDESEVVVHARSRFRTFHDRIWPEMEKLVAEDLKDERLRQLVNQGVSESVSRGGGESGIGESVSRGLDDLSDDLRKELERAMREAAERAAAAAEETGEAAAQEREGDARKLREAAKGLRAGRPTPSPDAPAGTRRSPLPPPLAPPRAGGEPSPREGEKGEGETVHAEGESAGAADLDARASELEQRAKDIRARGAQRAKDLRAGKAPQPVPLDQLSDALRRALEEAYAKLPADVRKRLEAAARRALEELEDALNKETEGKLTPDKPESHTERHEREEQEAEARERERQRAEDDRRAHEELERALEQSKTPYDRVYAEVAPLIDQLTDDLERLFQKQRHPRWKPGFPWSRLDLRKAMQFEADPSRHEDLGEHKTIPEKHDRTFTLLVDLSGSMQGEKIAETFKAAILIAEALARVGINVEILGFQDELIEFKRADEPMSDEVRGRMSGMLAEVLNQNPGGRNRAEWNDDGYCVDRAATRLRERAEREKFLVVLSDGLPEPSPAHAGGEWDLKTIVERIRREGGVRLVGIGNGPGTEHVRSLYPNSVVEEDVRKLPPTLAALFEDMIANPETY